MKTKIENLSFIVLISFQFGIGTDKTYSSEAISDLKKGKYFIDKCSSRDVIPLEESDNGCVEHNYVGRKCFFRVGQINARNVEKMAL